MATHLVQDGLDPFPTDLELKLSPLDAVRVFFPRRRDKLELDLVVRPEAVRGEKVEVALGQVGAPAFEEGAFLGLQAERLEVCVRVDSSRSVIPFLRRRRRTLVREN